jgi:HPt (histidine-containing phosphotransfer) domain-containing protein
MKEIMNSYFDPGERHSTSKPGPWNRSAALESVGGDEVLLRELIQVFLIESPKYLTQIEEALLLHDQHLLEFAAHSLRGGLGYLGVPETSEAAQQLETAGRTGKIEGATELFLCLRFRMAELWTVLDPNARISF